ncbi:MAG: alpha/beta fold hydrolase [Acidimicrobiales bacterium]
MPWATATDGVLLHYEVIGFGRRPPVLFVQGLGAEKNGWNLQRAALALRWRTIALDNRGAGRSEKPEGTYDLEQMADDAITVLDAAGVDAAHVVGLSMGGAISQIIALKYPHRVRSLTLVATACRNHEWREELLKSWADIARTQGMGALGREAARWTIGPRSFRRVLPALGWLGPMQLFNPARAFESQVNAILRTDDSLSVELGNISCPTLVVVGNQDILTPRGDAEEIASLIPTAELVVISGGAHGLTIEHAATFNRVLLEFLGRAEKVWVPRGDAALEAV